MNIKEKVIEVCKILDELDIYNEQLPVLLSTLDKKRSDLLHIIELKSLNAPQRCKIIKEIKDIETERRKVKNDMEVMKYFKDNQTKLLNIDYRQLLMGGVGLTEKAQNERKYTYKGYTEEEIMKIIGE